ncbi:hypothetical protein V6N13_107022 [Hibiscus sabdariffa]|uniref:non-specific serine/threonine protein kinase n=1 Tax=Hibiscus sabdariffa TaxID=183260 RepID=A0ABR2F2H7_9ROSI
MNPFLLPSKFWLLLVSLFLIFSAKYVFGNNFWSCSSRPSCGDIQDIGYPFWGLGRPYSCGYPDSGFELHCNGGVLEITIMDATYRVLEISNSSEILTVSRIDYGDDICPTRLINSTFDHGPFQDNGSSIPIRLYYDCPTVPENLTLTPLVSNPFECKTSDRNTTGYYVTTDFRGTPIGDYLWLCGDSVILPVSNSEVGLFGGNRPNPEALEEAARVGFDLVWSANDTWCHECLNQGGECGHNLGTAEFRCYNSTSSPGGYHTSNKLVLGLGIAVAVTISIVLVICFVCGRFKGKSIPGHLCQGKMEDNAGIEAFIKKFGSLAPRRYFYGEIKKMTNKFEDKLGQGGYGTVYKGNLPDGRLVAVKVLGESKGNGEDFINEVASISRTSHVNIVTLIGFCFERSKRALIYEFMPHGSLDRFIYDRALHHQSRQLEWKTLYDIAVGIARGLEYLHQGCNTRILHFDIKPHNILLDENFCPKISDFGLSKLCERKESAISMACARGTIGYIAPEMVCRNFGGVSYKSDVYSYGMMVLEMVGGRKNIDVGVSQTSEIYFPSWIYSHLDQLMNLDLNGVTVVEEEISRKLIIVSLWCIQSYPSHRPSMTKVLEMLQGDLQSLIIPPRPFESSPVGSPKTCIETSSVS